MDFSRFSSSGVFHSSQLPLVAQEGLRELGRSRLKLAVIGLNLVQV